jgi:hypothetical protein
MNQTDSTPQSLYDWTQIIYVLHAVSLVTGFSVPPPSSARS